MAEYIVDTTQAEREYENMFPVFAVKFDRLLGCPLGEEIVRCKDCKHKFSFGNDILCKHPSPYLAYEDTLEVIPDGFCAWGERR